ncbi:MAG TPA: DUF72 domain-containing protein [Gemmatimonadaceae bacterium]|nr:DUF72 domain-containing protein [Gemmatimonadaceae bacterium]
MTMKLGMCGFTIGAAAYFKRFRVVEVQQTFYDPPPLATLEKWRRDAPPDFEFTMKAWQVITHPGTSRTYRRMRRTFDDQARAEAGGFRVNDTTLAAWATTLEAASTLEATAILFQCPPSFRPTDSNISAMHSFFNAIDRPAGVRFLWEPRGEWPDDLILALCRNLGLIHAVDPFIRPSLTPALLYWRLHGNKSHYANYNDEELRQIIAWLPENADIDAYVMFNNIPRVADVKRFLELLSKDFPARHSSLMSKG